ncbi:hypothetical protein [Microvirga solisilvae]|uniref:hypothetical protein n=1 Tax=Microvirga solisilvae TaxID=2919498 RepID=UPI001FB01F75|nr:hypothetical protein [Microvirga solisilvae]
MSFTRPFLALSALGFLGTLLESLALMASPKAVSGLTDVQESPSFFSPWFGATSLILLCMIAVGVALAEQTGLVSLMLRRLRGELHSVHPQNWRRTIDLAAIVGALSYGINLVLWRYLPGAYDTILLHQQELTPYETPWLETALSLHAGVSTELALRFGGVTLVLWLGMILLRGQRPPALIWAAVLMPSLCSSAISMAQTGAISLPVVFHHATGIALGCFHGWLYVSRTLEHAILAHVIVNAMSIGLGFLLTILVS